VHWSDDVFNHENVGFWHYLQPAYNVMGFISCAGTNFVIRSSAFAEAGMLCLLQSQACLLGWRCAAFVCALKAQTAVVFSKRQSVYLLAAFSCRVCSSTSGQNWRVVILAAPEAHHVCLPAA